MSKTEPLSKECSFLKNDEVSQVSSRFYVESHQGAYPVEFLNGLDFDLDEEALLNSHVIIDEKILTIYSSQLGKLRSARSLLVIEAQEKNKSLEKMPVYVDHLVQNKLRRNHQLLAIGGGIIQDITCFLAANMLRGVNWWFIPTTLLAQADSCIGSKSSINCGESKNILGTFTPPARVMIQLDFLKTLELEAIYSGLGEMLKVHAIDGEVSFNQIAEDYTRLFHDSDLMLRYLRRSLEIKKVIIEEDEFDRGLRHVMNYGHTFGHAIESATDYKIPHGIAVTIGMDMANYIAMQANITTHYHYERMHSVLQGNFMTYLEEPISFERFFAAILKDKKNIGTENVSLILLDKQGKPGKTSFPADVRFQELCADYLINGRKIPAVVNTGCLG